MKLDTWIGSNVYNMHSILFSLPVCSSIRLFSCLLNSESCDNLKIIKVGSIKRDVSISSNYTNTDFNLKLIINFNKQEHMIIKELFEGTGRGLLYCQEYKCLIYLIRSAFQCTRQLTLTCNLYKGIVTNDHKRISNEKINI